MADLDDVHARAPNASAGRYVRSDADPRSPSGGEPRDRSGVARAYAEPDDRIAIEDDERQADDEPEDEPEDDGGAGKKPLYRKPWFWILAVVLVVTAIAAFAYYWLAVRPYATTDDAFIDADTVEIAPQVSGSISEAPVESNTRVEVGDLLAKIDPTSLQATLQSRQADLAQSEAQLARSRTAVDQAKANVGQAQGQLQSAQAQSKSARDTFRRNSEISQSDSSAISQKTVSDSEDSAGSADADVEAAKSTVASVKASVPAAEADVRAAEASVTAAKSAVDSARIDVGYTTIVAPIAGQVVQKNINVGSYVAPGQSVMALVPAHLYVTANFKETQLNDIRVGQDVGIAVDAYPDVDFRGKVVSIQNGAGQAFQLLPPQNATGNYVKVVQRVPVRISIDSPDTGKYALGPGMSVVPSVEID